MNKVIWVLLLSSFMVLAISHAAFAQKTGQSKKTQFGVVTASKEIDLNSDAVPKGALIGAGVGLLSTRRGPSRQDRTRNVIVGSAAGAAIGSAKSSGQTGILYDVKVSTGVIQVVTDQTEMRVDDCVAVEQMNDTVTLRRVDQDNCTQARATQADPVPSGSGDVSSNCAAAKQQLLDAKTKEEAELAGMKVKMLCGEE